MENTRSKYEVVIGLEVHAQMLTKTKAYSADVNEFGSHPNTNISVVSLGHPGTLPVMNKQTIENAIKLGIACNSEIAENQFFARKNYFYPDLPKGYQITQDKTPICTGGFLIVKDDLGNEKKVGITRIHMEEDAGKSIHDQDMYDSLIDLNRAGVPLIEIVSEPDIRSAEEAGAYLTEIRKLVRYLDICDGNMEEGSMRCDANISVRKKGDQNLGNRCEVKNLNSIRNVQRAIEFEVIRQIDVIEAGGHIDQNTLNYDAVSGTTSVLRSKEMANDYRYFPEPDLPPVILTESYIEEVKHNMPALPDELFKKFINEFNLSEYDAHNILEQKEIALYYIEITNHTTNYKGAANWLMGAVKSYLNEAAVDIADFPLKPSQIAELVSIVDEGKINITTANQQLFPALLKDNTKTALSLATELNLIISTSNDDVLAFIHEAMAKYPEKVAEYKAGKKSLTGLFMGEVMKLAKGKLDPKEANKLLAQELER